MFSVLRACSTSEVVMVVRRECRVKREASLIRSVTTRGQLARKGSHLDYLVQTILDVACQSAGNGFRKIGDTKRVGDILTRDTN